MFAVGSAKAQGSKVKPASHVRAAQSNQSEGQSDIKDSQQLASYLSLDREISVTHLCVGWHRVIWVFSVDYLGKTREIT
jgi:hypothetical protein